MTPRGDDFQLTALPGGKTVLLCKGRAVLLRERNGDVALAAAGGPPLTAEELRLGRDMLDPRRHFGFTGTERGCSPAQREALSRVLRGLRVVAPAAYLFLHHGRCVGADAEARLLAAQAGFLTIAHPGDSPAMQALPGDWMTLPAKDNLVRNVDIVRASCLLLATPAEFTEIRRSGTWTTVRRARDAGRPVHLLRPDGTEQLITGGPR